ncbi:hypothetical protein ACOME3_008662 [Neoechinorhynchus agilis]
MLLPGVLSLKLYIFFICETWFFLRQWHDEFLTWNPRRNSNITEIFFSPKDIWIPDIIVFNSVDRAFSQTYEQYLVTVNHKGKVHWVYSDVARTYCSVNITLFPFDHQSCALEIQSWSRVKNELVPHYVPVKKMDCHGIKAEWDIKNIEWSIQEVNNIPWIKLVLEIRRNSTFYLYHLIFPFFLLSCLTLFVFWLPPDSGEKVTLTITILLALTVFLQLISNYTPKASENLPIIGIYFNINLILVLISVVMTILVLNVHFRGPKSSPVPGWIKKYVIEMLGVSIGISEHRYSPTNNDDNSLIDKTGCVDDCTKAENKYNKDENLSVSMAQKSDHHLVSVKVQILNNELRRYERLLRRIHFPLQPFIADEIDECRKLSKLIEHEQNESFTRERTSGIMTEWKTLAVIIDRNGACFNDHTCISIATSYQYTDVLTTNLMIGCRVTHHCKAFGLHNIELWTVLENGHIIPLSTLKKAFLYGFSQVLWREGSTEGAPALIYRFSISSY